MIAATSKNHRGRNETRAWELFLRYSFMLFLSHKRKADCESKRANEHFQCAIFMKFEIKDIRLKSPSALCVQWGGQRRGCFNFRFKCKKRRVHLLCHLKTKEYIRGVLSA